MAEDRGSARPGVLVVAHRTAATPRLLEAVRQRARRGPAQFTLLVPRDYWEPETERAAAVVELAVPLLEEACGARVEARIGDSDPFVAIQDALASGRYEEIIISTLPERVSHWLRRDLPTRVQALGLPLQVVVAEGRTERVGGAEPSA